ncbi:hypothetical protein LTR12_018052, partial [Friedmanniomyces endolithicus]
NVTPPTLLSSVDGNRDETARWLSAPWDIQYDPKNGQIKVACDWSAAPNSLKAKLTCMMYDTDNTWSQTPGVPPTDDGNRTVL